MGPCDEAIQGPDEPFSGSVWQCHLGLCKRHKWVSIDLLSPAPGLGRGEQYSRGALPASRQNR